MVSKKDDPDYFFQANGRQDMSKLAREICDTCPVVRECDEYSEITGSKYGVWGGKLKKR